MAINRNCFVTPVLMICVLFTSAQTVNYPALSSQLLKSTAADAALLLGKAVPGSVFTTASYTGMPQTGIIFSYDSTITDNQACKIESDGVNYIKFSAAEDNGLCFGLYQYLQNLGFRFYLPGSIWETTPRLSTVYKKTDSIFTSEFKYRTWFVSGGHNRWIMDNNNTFGWDTYFGDNGHNWSLYQRRNGMTGQYRFEGHRSDIITGTNISSWQNNPCFVASFNNSRAVNSHSVPDVNNTAAMQLWATTIQQKHTAYKNIIYSNTNLYVNQFRNFNYGNANVGIEVPDGAHWGNTKDNLGCSGTDYATESDQSITLANNTSQKIGSEYPNLRFQLYAYSTHADAPSANLPINGKLDIQLIPAVYQNLTSTNGLRNRWYNRTKNISEYNYLNLSDWSGETPSFPLDEFKTTIQIAKEKKSQGLVWEASPAKFASLPYLLAANQSLLNNVSIDKSLQEFCDNMFASAGKTIYNLLQLWTDKKNVAGGVSNRYRIPLYLQMIADAEQKIQHDEAVVKERLAELKAYLHYMILYYNWAADQSTYEAKTDKAAVLCIYLARINKMQLVNSYYLITCIVRKYAAGSNFRLQYNTADGQAYLNGNLPLITTAEIENDFRNDIARYSNLINKYQYETVENISNRFNVATVTPLEKIALKLSYTNGLDNYNRSEYFIKAPAAGSFTIEYKPAFDAPDKGYINFTVESTEKILEIIKDFTINRTGAAGTLTVDIPSAGNYKMTISSKYKSSVELTIITNKNIFYKSGGFFGNTTEIYKNDVDMPGYFYVPAGMKKIYFSIGNSNPGGMGFALEEKINNAFAIKDNNGKPLTAQFVNPNDSALFFIDVPEESSGKFCRLSKKSNYSLVFSNISNYLWYVEAKPSGCGNADFTISLVSKKSNCITHLAAVAKAGEFNWEVTDAGQTWYYYNQPEVDLPDYVSPNALVTLTNGNDCSLTKKLVDDANYLKAKQACASGAPEAGLRIEPVVYPNPSTGVFNFLTDALVMAANEIIISNSQGVLIRNFKNVSQFNINYVPAGLYWYKIIINGVAFNGKLVKL